MSDNQKEKSLHRKYSSQLVDPIERSASRGMLHAVGFTKDDFKKNKIGIASTWSEVTPCNIHIDALTKESANGINSAGGKAVQFNTITISDGISMGTKGMHYSLVSREVIADSIETVVACELMDGFVAIGGCDKNMPACVMAMARLNRPSVFVYGGTILPGKYKEKDVDIVSLFEAVGKHANNEITKKELHEIEECAIPGPGSCGGMYTANTMASAIEAMGLSLPNSSAQSAISDDKKKDCFDAGVAVLNMIEKGITPRDLITKKSLENAIVVINALGGSTNAVLHLLAIAHTANIDLKIKDFNRIAKKAPVLADLRPSGKYFMIDLVNIGGIIPLMKILLENGYLHGDCLTVTGKTLAENLNNFELKYPKNQKIIRPLSNPIKKEGNLVILYGNIAPNGAVAKISGKQGENFVGTAKVFESEESALKAILNDEIKKGNVIVIRGEGPKGGPGMREMLSPTSAIIGKGLSKDVALITDGRFSGGTHGFVVGHISPEAFSGGLIALIKNDDKIKIDAKNKSIDLLVNDDEISIRKKSWISPKHKHKHGVLAKYAKLVSSASHGAVTDKNLF